MKCLRRWMLAKTQKLVKPPRPLWLIPKDWEAWNERFQVFYGTVLPKPWQGSILDWDSKLAPWLKSESNVLEGLAYFLNRYPSKSEWEAATFQFLKGGRRGFLEYVAGLPKVRQALRTVHPAPWRMFPEGSLWIEATVTLADPYASGIPRVVRELAHETSSHPSCFWMKWDTEAGPVHAVAPHVLERPFSWGIVPFFKKMVWAFVQGARDGLKHLPRFFYEGMRQGLLVSRGQSRLSFEILERMERGKPFLHLWKVKMLSRVRKGWPLFSPPPGPPRLWLKGQSVLIPEIILEPAAIEFWEMLRLSTLRRLSLLIHDLIPLSCPESVPDTLRFPLFLNLLRVADRVFVTTETTKEQVEAFRPLVLRRLPHPYEVSVHALGHAPAGFRTSVGFSEGLKALQQKLADRPFILSVGTIEPRKNHLALLRAFLLSHTKKASLVLVGSPGWKMGPFLEELQQAQQQGAPVFWFSRLKDAELVWLYQKALFSVVPSQCEGFGLPFLEALGFHKPVLVHLQGSLKEIAEKIGAGYAHIDPSDLTTFAHQLSSWIDSPPSTQEIAPAKLAAASPSWRSFSSDILREARK